MKTPTSLLGGSFVFALFYLGNFITRFATSVIVARTLGVESKGIYTLILLASTMAILLVNPGIHTALVFFASNARFSVSKLAVFSLTIVVFTSLTVIVLLFGLFHLDPDKEYLAGIPTVYLGWGLVSVPFNLGSLLLSSILLGRQNFLEFNLVESFRLASNLILQGISAFVGGGLKGAIASWLAANGLAFLAALWYLRKEWLNSPSQNSTASMQPIFSYGIRNYPVNLLNFINTRLDTFLVNIFAGASQVGLYTTSASMAEILWFVPNAFGNTVFARIPILDSAEANNLTGRACRQTILVMVILLAAAAICGPVLIPLFFGSVFAPAGLPFLLLLPGILGLGVNRVLAADFNGRGKPQFVTLSALASAGVTLAFDLALIPRYGMLGAASASSLAYLTSAILLIAWSKQQNGLEWKFLLFPSLRDIAEVYDFSMKLVVRLFNPK